MKAFSDLWQYLAELFLEWEMFRSCTKIETHILCSQIIFQKSLHLWHNVEEYGGAREAAGNMAHELFMLDK